MRLRRESVLVGALGICACSETVDPTTVGSVVISPDSAVVVVGDSLKFSVTTLDSNGGVLADRSVEWALAETSFVSISQEGTVTAAWRPGLLVRTVEVIATSERVSDTATVRIVPTDAAAVIVTPDSTLLSRTDSIQLTSSVRDASDRELADRVVTWTTEDSTVARVSDRGRVRAVGKGTTEIVASHGNISASTIIAVSNIGLRLYKPAPQQRVIDSVLVNATAISLLQLATVTASTGSTQADLAFVDNCDSPFGIASTMRCWSGWVHLAGEPFGWIDLEVTATDVFGDSRSLVVPVVHEAYPVLTIRSPAPGAIATPELQVDFSCEDPGAAACASVSVLLAENGTVLASGGSSIGTTISLAAYAGDEVALDFRGRDSAGLITNVQRSFWVLPDDNFERLVEVPGFVLDYDGVRTLYEVPTGSRDVLRIREADGTHTTVLDQVGRMITDNKAFLMPAGAIFVSRDGPVSSQMLHEFRGGTTTALASGTIGPLAVRGNFATWAVGPSVATPLYLRDLVAAQTTLVAEDASSNEYDVSVDGDVAYYTGGATQNVVYVPFGGSRETLSTGPLWNNHPRTDGGVVVFRKQTPCCTNQTYQIYLATPGGPEVQLTTPSNIEVFPGSSYEVNNGWVVFRRRGAGGETQVWSRTPAGVLTQLTFFGSSSGFSAIDGNGVIILGHGDTRYRAAPPYATLEPLPSLLGSVRVRGGQFVLFLDGSVFAVP